MYFQRLAAEGMFSLTLTVWKQATEFNQRIFRALLEPHPITKAKINKKKENEGQGKNTRILEQQSVNNSSFNSQGLAASNTQSFYLRYTSTQTNTRVSTASFGFY